MKDDETSPSFPNGKSDKQMIELAESPFGIHEALHTCSVLMDTFGLRVAEHPAVALRPAILAKAEDAIERMMDVYQALGALPEWHEDITPPNGDEVREALEELPDEIEEMDLGEHSEWGGGYAQGLRDAANKLRAALAKEKRG